MQIVRTSEELTLARGRPSDSTLALVPTMGALHDGHLRLVEHARTLADRVAATIFVNPLQFNDAADLDLYPRQEESDLAKLSAAGCDIVWLPAPADLYPDGFSTTVSVAGISERWEGEFRPGHFDGVATVVAKLLAAIRPDFAVFGEKDFQQLAVIRRMARDLGLGAAIVGVATVREADGLAMSSRNALLSADQRARAVALPRALERAGEAIRGGGSVADALEGARRALIDAGFTKVDYVALVDAATLDPLEAANADSRLIAAATIGITRLIDNIAL